MSSELAKQEEAGRDGLCNLDYLSRYSEILEHHLPEKFVGFGAFYTGINRLETLAVVLQKFIKEDGLDVLNVGCGPFATEIFVERLQAQNIQSFDYTPEFLVFFHLFQDEGVIPNTVFRQADAMQVEFPEQTFDLMIIHDVFYEAALEMTGLISRLRTFLKKDGYLYFDFVNARTQWIWRLLGKQNQFRSYSPAFVKKSLADNGFEIVAFEPTAYGARSFPARILHRSLRLFFGASNNYSVLIRNTG